MSETKNKEMTDIKNLFLLSSYERKAWETQAVPACREASEPLFGERSDAVKVCETLCLG